MVILLSGAAKTLPLAPLKGAQIKNSCVSPLCPQTAPSVFLNMNISIPKLFLVSAGRLELCCALSGSQPESPLPFEPAKPGWTAAKPGRHSKPSQAWTMLATRSGIMITCGCLWKILCIQRDDST